MLILLRFISWPCVIYPAGSGTLRTARPYLQRCAERGHAVQTEAPRRATRPGDALRPRLAVSVAAVLVTVVGAVALPPGAHGAAEEENNPQGEARRGGAACGQHRVRERGDRRDVMEGPL